MAPLFQLRPGLRLLLASASPRRKELLASLGVEFTIAVSQAVESPPTLGETPAAYALRMAELKGSSLTQQSSVVIAADTVVSLGQAIFGKPENSADALAMLTELNGQKHEVTTGVYVADVALGSPNVTLFHETTEVLFGRFPSVVLQRYANSGEPLDKAGAYAIQGLGAFLVERIMGSHSNVIGLPLEQLSRHLLKAGILY